MPGLILCGAVGLAATAAAAAEQRWFGKAWLEPLVLAILIGAAVRAWAPLPSGVERGTGWAAKILLELAVALMGVAMSVRAVAAVGLPLLGAVMGLVFLSVAVGFLIGRALGLPPRMAVLLACGNSICGNSAIAAVAPAIDARAEDVAAAIAFTAVLGVAVVLALPVAATLLHLRPVASGALAGMTVYAVPQVLAAAAPMGATAIRFGTLVKLVRVLMLGPVVVALSALFGLRGAARPAGKGARPGLGAFLPWFVLAFLALAGLRSAGAIPAGLVGPTSGLANGLTVVSMAGLGLGVDVRSVRAAGPRVAASVTLSLLFLAGAALGVLYLVGLA